MTNLLGTIQIPCALSAAMTITFVTASAAQTNADMLDPAFFDDMDKMASIVGTAPPPVRILRAAPLKGIKIARFLCSVTSSVNGKLVHDEAMEKKIFDNAQNRFEEAGIELLPVNQNQRKGTEVLANYNTFQGRTTCTVSVIDEVILRRNPQMIFRTVIWKSTKEDANLLPENLFDSLFDKLLEFWRLAN